MGINDIVIAGVTYYDWPILEPYVVSLCRSGFDGEKVILAEAIPLETKQKLKEKGFTVVAFPHATMQPHVVRFKHAHGFLLLRPQARYVVWTDIRDVVFQANPIAWLVEKRPDAELVAASECLRYKDEPWGDRNMREAYGEDIYVKMKDKEIYNCGTLMGKAGTISKLLQDVYLLAVKAMIPIADQAAFNILLHHGPYKDVLTVPKQEEGFGCICGTTVDRPEQFGPHLLDLPPSFDWTNNLICAPKTRRAFSIIHQYDRTPWGIAVRKKWSEQVAAV